MDEDKLTLAEKMVLAIQAGINAIPTIGGALLLLSTLELNRKSDLKK